MTDVIMGLMLTLAVTIGWIGVARLIRGVRQTSLAAAAAWAVWFQVTLTITTIATLAKSRTPLGVLDQLWYLTAVSALCPFVAVLGARRGRLLEWSLFVVLPLIIVLEWPALAQWSDCSNGQRLELETPTLIGYLFVLTMSLGGYLVSGTRYSPAVICWAQAWCAAILSFSNPIAKHLPIRAEHYVIFNIALQIVCWWSAHWGTRLHRRSIGWDRVWQDLRAWFGDVWAARIMARINEVAQREQWPWRLTHQGMQPSPGEPADPGSPIGDPRVDHAFRWLLKPFVDPEWIDARLNAEPL